MAYFKKIETLDGLKAEYRRLALANHPDKGGAVEAMQEINMEFEVMFRILKKASPKAASTQETATGYRKQFYTENGWAGSRFDANLSLKEIAQIVRDYLKNVYPTWKFSVSTKYASMYQALNIAVTETPVDIFSRERLVKAANYLAWRRSYQTEEEALLHLTKTAYESGYIQNWESWTDERSLFTDYAQIVLDDVQNLVESYNFSDCDSQIDYFHVNFYSHFDIGKCNKPVKIVPRTARIVSTKADNTLKRLAG